MRYPLANEPLAGLFCLLESIRRQGGIERSLRRVLPVRIDKIHPVPVSHEPDYLNHDSIPILYNLSFYLKKDDTGHGSDIVSGKSTFTGFITFSTSLSYAKKPLPSYATPDGKKCDEKNDRLE